MAVAICALAACAPDRRDGAADLRSRVVAVSSLACAQTALGGGVVVDNSLVVTNAHVVAGAEQIVVTGVGSRPLEARAVAFDPSRDLAVLRADGLAVDRLAFAPAQSGDSARVGRFEGGEVAIAPAGVARRIVATGEDIYRDAGARRRALQLSAGISAGDSGAGVFDNAGALLGVVFARSRTEDETAYAVAASEIEALLESLPPDPRPVHTGRCLP
jgi:S1-C subfamily serine protease